MIIIHPTGEDEESEYFTQNQKNYEDNRESSEKISTQTSSKHVTLYSISLVLLLAVSIYLGYTIHSLQKEMELIRKNADQLLLLEASLLNYPPSDYLLPPSISLQKNKVSSNETKIFQTLLSHFIMPYSDTDCQLKRFGNKLDGGYLFCSNLLGQSEALLNFGIGDDDSFGCEITKKFGIPNYQFDCTSSPSQECGSDNLVNFNNLCLGGEDATINEKEHKKLQSILEKFKIEQSHLLVKIDVEGAEWEALARVPLQVLDRIDQLQVEFHLGKPEGGLSWHYLGILKSLTSKFVPVNVHMNNFGCFGIFSSLHFLPSNSFQVTFVNRRLLQLHSYDRSFSSNRQNHPNAPFMFDCQQS